MYFYHDGRTEVGPLDLEKLKVLLNAGLLSESTLTREASGTSWSALSTRLGAAPVTAKNNAVQDVSASVVLEKADAPKEIQETLEDGPVLQKVSPGLPLAKLLKVVFGLSFCIILAAFLRYFLGGDSLSMLRVIVLGPLALLLLGLLYYIYCDVFVSRSSWKSSGSAIFNWRWGAMLGLFAGIFLAIGNSNVEIMFDPDSRYYRAAQFEFFAQLLGSIAIMAHIAVGLAWLKRKTFG